MNKRTKKIHQLRRKLYKEYIALALEIIRDYSPKRRVKIAPYAVLPDKTKAYIWVIDGKIVKDVNNHTINLGFSSKRRISADEAAELLINTFKVHNNLATFTKTLLTVAKQMKERGES